MAIHIMEADTTVRFTDLTTVTAGVVTMILSFTIHGMHGVLAGAGEDHTGAATTTAIGMAITTAIMMVVAGDIRIITVQTDIMDTEAVWQADHHIHQEVQEALERATTRKILMLAVAVHAVDQLQAAETPSLTKPLRQEVVTADIPEVQLNKKLPLNVKPGLKDLLVELKGLSKLKIELHHLLQQRAKAVHQPMKKLTNTKIVINGQQAALPLQAINATKGLKLTARQVTVNPDPAQNM